MTCDMQKVIMLPRMPGIRNCCFTRRLVQFHKTFSPLGGKRKGGKPMGLLWDESVSGRNADDVANTHTKFMRHPNFRDKGRFLIYADNCSAQNNNWTVFTAMVNEVNREGGPDEIII